MRHVYTIVLTSSAVIVILYVEQNYQIERLVQVYLYLAGKRALVFAKDEYRSTGTSTRA